MKHATTANGHDIIEFTKGYISFGNRGTEEIKWLYLSFNDADGVPRGAVLPITLKKVKREHSNIIGMKNLKKIREAIKPNLEGEILPRENLVNVFNILDGI